MKVQELLEATFNTDEIVNFIYNKVYKKYFENVKNYKNKGKTVPSDIIISRKNFTPELLSENIKDSKFNEALDKIPITIMAGSSGVGNAYQALNGVITIDFTNELYRLLHSSVVKGEDYEDMMSSIPSNLRKMAETEFSGYKVRGSIAHEISHWMGDAFHNQHLTKMMQKTKDKFAQVDNNAVKQRNKIFYRNQPDIYMTDYEVDAMIHDVKEFKKLTGQKKWDKLTSSEFISMSPALQVTFDRINSKSITNGKKFKRLILQRMARENLLGKNMR